MSALRFTHENGYSYNDLKPENIMISNAPDSNSVGVKLIDYGFLNNFI
jgi:serine/threonine protein kinase